MTSVTIEEIRQEAFALGWDDVGVTEAKIPAEDIAAYKSWLSDGNHADLAYMQNEIRCDPEAILPGAKSAILFITYYKQPKLPFRADAGLIASYARGKDYHNVHRRRLKKFIQWLEERTGQTGIARGFSDSKPILEKALAVRAGLGWFGKNTLLIHRKFGTFTLLSGVLTTLELPQTGESLRLPKCGSCTRCLDACPTGALVSPYQLDAGLCLSYHLIESKKEIPSAIQKKNPGYVFGCDICQDACPHNMRKEESQTEAFSPESGMGSYLTLNTLRTVEENPDLLNGTPLKRRGVKGLRATSENLLAE